MPKLKIGTDDFKEMREEDGYFIDKSALIREVIDGSKCQLLPRPRRFGKTLNMSMLRYFFALDETDHERDLEKLLAGEELRYPIDDSITFQDIGRGTRNIWSFLYYSGYLRASTPEHDPLDGTRPMKLDTPPVPLPFHRIPTPHS